MGTLNAMGALAAWTNDGHLGAAREAGLDDAKIIDVIAQVALLTLTNSLNNVARTDMDFPPRAL